MLKFIHHNIQYMSELHYPVAHRVQEAYATWPYMFVDLSKMNWENIFILWTKLLCNNTNISLLLNETLSSEITLS